MHPFALSAGLIVFLLCSAFAIYTYLVIIGIGTFQNYYESILLKEYSSSTIAWIPSLQIFFMMAMASLIMDYYRYRVIFTNFSS